MHVRLGDSRARIQLRVRIAVAHRPRPGGATDTFILPRARGARHYAVRAIDDAGNIGSLRVR